MSVAVPAPPYFTPDRLWRWGRRACGLLAAAFIGALLAAWLGSLFQAKLNRESALQQQYLAALQQFNHSGAELDVSITNFADAIVDRKGINEARQKARTAIGAHLSASQGLSEIVGKKNMDAYMEGVGTERELVDQATDAKSAMRASQARFDVMHNRTVIRSEALKNIYR